jgi:hypothetical protein
MRTGSGLIPKEPSNASTSQTSPNTTVGSICLGFFSTVNDWLIYSVMNFPIPIGLFCGASFEARAIGGLFFVLFIVFGIFCSDFTVSGGVSVFICKDSLL